MVIRFSGFGLSGITCGDHGERRGGCQQRVGGPTRREGWVTSGGNGGNVGHRCSLAPGFVDSGDFSKREDDAQK